ncbi:VID27 cytoplasmic protein-domain-containing protein [Polychytrium aggregatum]|uniref:VID27 cytoplasmic protein-domain-containing protein n=1 Tax=Polychytrium aggregatum TaxID=110093 RepID=UPI0022FDE776|nr:VID27 cytoplasmic protein-domain-containing protein [Polychytrium aggregatum]KAI9202669.1 VID27 cytoplasmic protein-domain-containing protein [Polychytrium aggregatum]
MAAQPSIFSGILSAQRPGDKSVQGHSQPVQIEFISGPSKTHALAVHHNPSQVTMVPISPALYFHFEQAALLFSWVPPDPSGGSGIRSPLYISLPDQASFWDFLTQFVRCLQQAKHGQVPVGDDLDYLREVYSEPMDIDEPEKPPARPTSTRAKPSASSRTPGRGTPGRGTVKSASPAKTTIRHYESVRAADESAHSGDETENQAEEEEEEEEQEEEEEHKNRRRSIRSSLSSGSKRSSLSRPSIPNSELVIGIRHQQSYVVSGETITVLKYDDNKLKPDVSVNVTNLSRKGFSPSKVHLYDSDSSLLMMDAAESSKLYRMDLNVGKIVEEWQVDDRTPITDIVPDSKYAQTRPQNKVVAFNSNSIFSIDPRLAGNKRVESDTKQYSGNPKFSSCATTEKGQLAVGSDGGDIRLFSKLPASRATTLFPSLGDPILAIDTSNDGRYVLITCGDYLLLLDTSLKHNPATNGFSTRMSADSRQAPKRLQLKLEHITLLGGQIEFTPAKFNCEEGVDEPTSILTSSGVFVIKWNFRKIKLGKLYEYTIRKCAGTIVADQFKYGSDRAIVVALSHDVKLLQGNLDRPESILKKERA